LRYTKLPPNKLLQVMTASFLRDRKTVPSMPTGPRGATPIETRKQIELLVVEGNSADARVTLSKPLNKQV
jgi:hypothetical protein